MFTVALPASEEKATAPEREPFLLGERGKILAVDDEENVRFLLQEMLSLHGHEVTVAADAERGLEILEREGPFDLVVTDLGMPGISGWEFARRVRQRDPTVRIILSTGWADTILPHQVEGTGVTRVLPKPFEMADLLAVVGEELRARKVSSGV
jgi:CheY-like chemotaxis protein